MAAAERTLDSGDGLIGSLLNNIGKALTEQGRAGEALAYFDRALPIVEAAYGAASSGYARTLSNAADARLGAGDPRTAMPMYREALAVLAANEDPDHPWTLHARERLAAATAARAAAE